jgi:hypothetical protein
VQDALNIHAPSTRRWSTRSGAPACSIARSATRSVRCSGTRSAAASARPRPVGGAQAGVRSRARDRAFVPEEYWNIFARLAGRSRPSSKPSCSRRRRHDQGPQRGRVEARLATSRAPRGPSRRSRRRSASARRAAVHHQQAAADGALPGQEDDDARAAAVRGRHRDPGLDRRPHHLHATDSVRVADEALTAVRDYIKTRSATSSCRRSRTSTSRRPTRRTRTKRSVRRRSSTIPRRSSSTSRRISTRSTADLEPLRRSQMPPATFDETTVDVAAGELPVPRQGHRPEVRRLDGRPTA